MPLTHINNLTKAAINKKTFSTVAKKVLSGENRESESISLAFVEKGEIRKLNLAYRKKDKPTDVLSFELDERDLLGEIVICPEVVSEHAQEYGVTYEYEMMKVFIHGILHLLGYDHERSRVEEAAMDERQNKYLRELKLI